MTLYTNGTVNCIALENALKEKGLDFVVNTDTEEMKDKCILACPALEVNGKLLKYVEAMDYVKSGVHCG